MKRAFWAASALTLALAACGGPKYPNFENQSYRVEANTIAASGTGQQLQTVIYRDGSKMRVETHPPSGAPATIVFDEATNAAYLLQAAATPAAATTTSTAGTPPAAAPSATPPAPGATPSATGPTVNPAAAATTTPAQPAAVGVAIRVADSDAPQPVESAWAALGAEGARSVGECSAAGEDGHDWQAKNDAAGVPRTACITDDGIVLRIREGDAVLYEVTRLQRGAQDPSLFGVPAGYTLVDPTAVVESVGDAIGQLDSVQGGAQAPVTPPTAGAPAPATP
jgi:hypothetical protein